MYHAPNNLLRRLLFDACLCPRGQRMQVQPRIYRVRNVSDNLCAVAVPMRVRIRPAVPLTRCDSQRGSPQLRTD